MPFFNGLFCNTQKCLLENEGVEEEWDLSSCYINIVNIFYCQSVESLPAHTPALWELMYEK